MRPLALGYRLPEVLSVPLFGDRRRFGLVAREDDPDWEEWQQIQATFYDDNQKQGVGKIVNDAGYRVLRQIDLKEKRVLEIGPGDLNHFPNWNGTPASLSIVDVEPEFLARSERRLDEYRVPFTSHLVPPRNGGLLPFDDETFDVLLSFYSLEHLHPLGAYLDDQVRVLRRGGLLVGAIPAEGGLLWGLGRYLTTRRWLRKHSRIDPDKIICWEHTSFADQILSSLDQRLNRKSLRYWPARVPCVDLNLVIRFIYEKP